MASLAGVLQNSSLDDLLKIATAWGITPEGDDARSYVRTLLSSITDHWRLRSKLEEMSEPERQILFFLADNLFHWATTAEIARHDRLSMQQADPLFANIAKHGLVLLQDWQEYRKNLSTAERWREHLVPDNATIIVMPVELVPAVNAVKRDMDEGDISYLPLESILQKISSRQLQSIAKQWDIPHPYEYAKQNLIQELLKAMTDAHRIWDAAQLLHPKSPDLLTLVVEHGGKIPIAEARKALSDNELRAAFDALSHVLIVQETYINKHGFLFVPLEMRRALGSEDAEANRLSLGVVQPAGETKDCHLIFVEDLLTLGNFVGNNRVELTSNGYIPQRVMSRIGSLLHLNEGNGADAPRLRYVLDSGVRVGLVKVANGRLVPGDNLDSWYELSRAEQVRKALSMWLSSTRAESGVGLESIGVRISWPSARSRLLKCLAASCKQESWYEIRTFAQHVMSVEPELLGRTATLGELRRLSDYYRFDAEEVISSFVGNTLTSPLYWFGIVALAEVSPGSSRLCFKLTPLGAWALEMPGGEPPPEPAEKPLIVQPNFEILSISAGGRVLKALSAFADLKRSDQASVYALTKESVLRGVDTGLTPDEMIEFLDKHSQKELPQNVAYSIADWARQYRPMSFSSVTLVEVENEEILTEILASKRFSDHFARRLSPTTAVVKPEVDLKKLSNELRKRGYSPNLGKEQAEPRRKNLA